jgi:hypothetical protein
MILSSRWVTGWWLWPMGEQGEHHHPAWVLHHLTHPNHLLKVALSALSDYRGLADKPYIYVPTYLYLHTNLGFCNCHFRSRKGAGQEQGRFCQSCERGCPSSRGAGQEQARAGPEQARASPSRPGALAKLWIKGIHFQPLLEGFFATSLFLETWL